LPAEAIADQRLIDNGYFLLAGLMALIIALTLQFFEE